MIDVRYWVLLFFFLPKMIDLRRMLLEQSTQIHIFLQNKWLICVAHGL